MAGEILGSCPQAVVRMIITQITPSTPCPCSQYRLWLLYSSASTGNQMSHFQGMNLQDEEEEEDALSCHTLGVISLSLPGGMSSWCESSSFSAAFFPKLAHVYFGLKMRLLCFHSFPALTLGLLFSVSSHLAFCSTVPITDKAHGQREASEAAPVFRRSWNPQQIQQQLRWWSCHSAF